MFAVYMIAARIAPIRQVYVTCTSKRNSYLADRSTGELCYRTTHEAASAARVGPKLGMLEPERLERRILLDSLSTRLDSDLRTCSESRWRFPTVEFIEMYNTASTQMHTRTHTTVGMPMHISTQGPANERTSPKHVRQNKRTRQQVQHVCGRDWGY